MSDVIKNKKEAAEYLAHIIQTIERMTPGNLAHHRNSIRYQLERLCIYLSLPKSHVKDYE